jgi:hypothetical protein
MSPCFVVSYLGEYKITIAVGDGAHGVLPMLEKMIIAAPVAAATRHQLLRERARKTKFFKKF